VKYFSILDSGCSQGHKGRQQRKWRFILIADYTDYAGFLPLKKDRSWVELRAIQKEIRFDYGGPLVTACRDRREGKKPNWD
jgi:hypothetical protein